MKTFLVILLSLFFLIGASKPTPQYPEFPVTKKHMIAFRGLNGALDEDSLEEWCDKNKYVLKIFDYTQEEKALTYAMSLKTVHLEILGFSKGAESAYELAEDLGEAKRIRRMLTIGAYHTVTTSFATKRRPPLKNVKVHYNFVETWQQPNGFVANPNNVSVGNIPHLQSVKASLKLIDTNPWYQ